MKIFPIVFACFLFLGTLSAQDFSFGFKAGLNFSRIDGPSETDSNGSNLEEIKLTKGFQFGPIFNLKFTDVFGIRGELLYSQKGTDYSYNGQSFWIFYTEVGDPLYHFGGNRNMRLFISNSYLDVPFSAVARFGRIEASAGFSVGLLLGSKASGEVTYTGPNIAPFTIILEYNFGKDEPTIDPGQDPMIETVSGQTMLIPRQTSAYYGVFGREDKLFNALDMGVHAGLSFYLSKGLFIGFRFNYGLMDTTKEKQDLSVYKLGENNSFITRDEFDRNISLQASVGFSF